MAELRARVTRLAREMRVPEDQAHALTEKARALAELAKPTDDELAEIRAFGASRARALDSAGLAASTAHDAEGQGEER